MKQVSAPPVYRLNEYTPDPGVTRLLTEQAAREYLAVPLRIEDGKLVVASAKPRDGGALHMLSRVARRPILPLAATYPDVREALDAAYGGRATSAAQETVAADLCVRFGYLRPDHLPLIREKMARSGKPFFEACDSLGLIRPEDRAEAEGLLSGQPNLREKTLNGLADLSELVPWEVAQKWQIVPLFWVGSRLLVGTPKALVHGGLREIANKIQLPVQACILSAETWQRLYRRFYLRGTVDANLDLEIARALVAQGRLTETGLNNALDVQRQTADLLETILVREKLIDRKEWLLAKARAYKVAFYDLQRTIPVIPGNVRERFDAAIPPRVAAALGVRLLQVVGSHWEVGLAEPARRRVRAVEQMLNHKIEPRLIDTQALKAHSPAGLTDDGCLPSIEEYAFRLGFVSPDLAGAAQTRGWSAAGDVEALLSAGLIDDVDLAELQALHCDLPYVRLEHIQFSETDLKDLPRSLMTWHNCFPLFATQTQVWLATSDPLDGAALREVELATGKRVWPVIAPRSIIQSVVGRYVAPEQKSERREELRIVEKLVDSGMLTQLEATRVLQMHDSLGAPLDVAIARNSTYPPEALTQATASILGIATFNAALHERMVPVIDPLGGQNVRAVVTDLVEGPAARLIDLEVAQKWCVLPVQQRQDRVIAAFADPIYQPALEELQNRIGGEIIPVLTPRAELEDAIQRALGRWNLGTYLLKEGLITRRQLNRALDLANRTGVRLGKALVNQRFLTQKQLYNFLARQSRYPFVDLAEFELDEALAREIPADMARQYGMLPIATDGDSVILATTDPLNEAALALASQTLQRPVSPAVVTDTDLDLALERIYSHAYLEQSVSELLERVPQDSAYKVLSREQVIFLIGFLVVSAGWILFNYSSYFIVLNVIATLFYLVYSGYKLYLIYRALDQDLEVPVTQEDLTALKDSDLPVYSVLIPVYHEAEMLPDLLNAVARFDYPSTKLDIQVIMEEDDAETIQTFKDWNPPDYFHGVIVPSAQPKTKPKACNYGLIHARGEYVVIYDAEDLPEPDQLKKVLIAFNKSAPEVVCIQSKLNYYNQDQNLLTRWFTIEYSMWFDLFLPGLNATSAPIPLGGTSNHFKRDALLEIAAWDPYNVTEDADLGIRLYKRGYKTAIVDSTTYEEANSKLNNWIRQRSRWIKGYIQTWLVHMRHPIKMHKEIGFRAFWGFQFVVGGNFFTALLNPIYWIFTTLWFVLKWQFIQMIFPSVIFYLGAICLFLGNFAFTYINVAGAMRRNYYGMVKYALLSPIYWALASIAAWRGFFQLFRNPFFWEKTHHGLHDKVVTPPTPDHEEAPPPIE